LRNIYLTKFRAQASNSAYNDATERSKLRKIKSANDIYDQVALTPAEAKIRDVIRYSFEDLLARSPLPANIHGVIPFGSYVKYLATKTSDLDLTIITDGCAGVDFSYHNFLPSWNQEPGGRRHAVELLESIEMHLRSSRMAGYVTDIDPMMEATFPVLTFSIADVPIQLTVNNITGLNESEITAKYFRHQVLRRFATIVLTWARFHKLSIHRNQPKNFIIMQLLVCFLIEHNFMPPVSHFVDELSPDAIVRIDAKKFHGTSEVDYRKINKDLKNRYGSDEQPIKMAGHFLRWLAKEGNFATHKVDILEVTADHRTFQPKGVKDDPNKIYIKSMVNAQNIAGYLNYGDGFSNMAAFLDCAHHFQYSRSPDSLFQQYR